MGEFIDNLLGQMTLQEKVALLAGADMWHTVPIERLGIPSLKMTDGPNGARGSGRSANSLTSACFPVGIALAATWNTELVEHIGQALAQEALSKGARVLLAPTVNIHRSPLNGRNFECFSEDPYLSARMAVAYITGVQSEGVGATVKHFVCNDSEFERFTISSEVRERVLREIYLVPFKAAVQEAGVWAVMASYNKVNGVYASEKADTLTRILREAWGFDGLIMSDWYGTKSTAAAVNAGLDLEMPGPTLWRGESVLQAVKDGEVHEATIDERARRVLQLIDKAGLFAQREPAPEQAVDLPEHRELAREAAAEGMVLLKNERDVLPLRRESLRSLAIIGPNAKTARIMGGGSSMVNPHYAVTPLDGITASAGAGITIDYEPGCTNHKLLPLLDARLISSDKDGVEHGLTLEFFNNADLSGTPVLTTRTRATELYWLGQVPEGVDTQQFSVRCSGWFTPQETGTYTFGLVSVGLSRFFIDGREVIDNWTQQTGGESYYGIGTIEVKADINLEAGRAYEIAIELSKNAMVPLVAMRLGCFKQLPADALERAASLAASADVALVCVGLSNEWESEGFDRPDMELVGEQVALIEKVAAANKNTVVIINTGSPAAMPWLDQVAAVVQAWFPGQECGNAIADILFGDVSPSGKLPQTFPARLEDNPAYLNYPGENGRVYYGEGLFVGYRYYEKKGIAPLFPFGFGLSYTTFSYSNLRLSSTHIDPDDTLHVTVDITNTGQRAGKEVAQLYIRDVAASLQRPEKELKSFAKVQLAPGETKTVTFAIARDSLAYYDDLAHQWVAEAGEFKLLIGSSSWDIRSEATFTLTTTSRW